MRAGSDVWSQEPEWRIGRPCAAYGLISETWRHSESNPGLGSRGRLRQADVWIGF